MSVKSCVFCNTALDGWVYDEKVSRSGLLHVVPDMLVAQLCHSCGAAVCYKKHNKEIKGNNWLGLDKAICPRCGGPFGRPDFMTRREVCRADFKELPTGNMAPWALKFLDAANGESLLAADQPDLQFYFSLILTDRRLIVLSPLDIGSGNKPWELTVPDRYFITWPLHNLVGIEAKPVETHSSKMTIKTDTGESHTWQFSPPFDNFAVHIKNALPKASNPLTFPAGEELFFDGGSNLEILNLIGDSPFIETELLARQFFNKFARLSLAITNRRLLFYRINHIQEMVWQGSSMEVKLGPPNLQFISLPWEAVRRIEVSGGIIGGGVTMILDQPVWAWTIPGLKLLPHDEITCEVEIHPCARCGGNIFGGVGSKRKTPHGQDIETSISGTFCSKCGTAYHKNCLKSLESPTSKCPTCGQPRQVIDRGYYKLNLKSQAQLETPGLLLQFNIPPVGKFGEEWKLTLLKNANAWQTQILPAVLKACPQVRIVGK
jgi:hypothetical protein